ncbi:2-oxo-4-hydroxy-4-carboxy-5-ureidoimidazoline decarboxylase [Streptomyces albireticuli]|uniref:2-oxo-4-hydroxy-4-carboxy-5-ureidoimidazoline decarboxylase n=1 Tax=Streptomyces albireticuli TaxID=1940 RepID=UPI0036AAB2E0
MTSSSTPGLTRFNTADDDEARTALRAVCASGAWVEAVLARRPYPDLTALRTTSDAIMAALTPADLAEATAAHPPIGRPTPGDPVSAREQRGMADAPAGLKAETLALNLAYQEKFGHVFLVCATGLSAARLRDAVRARIGNTPEREREIVREELGKINRIRLAGLVEAPGDTPDRTTTDGSPP